MEKYKYLFGNIGVLTIAKFSSSIISFLLLPFYTNVLSTAEYGTINVLVTTITLLIPVLTQSISDSVLRFSLDKDNDITSIVITGFKHIFLSFYLIAIFIVLNYIFNFIIIIKEYSIVFFLYYAIYSLNGLIIALTRGLDKVIDVAISSVIYSVSLVGLNIVFIAYYHCGIIGYLLAHILASFTQIIYLIFRIKIWQYIKLGNYTEIEKEMLFYSRPFILNNISWWINNVADRYIVTFFCGVALNGVYSIASKIPEILNIFQSIFNQAWTLSAVKDFDAEDKSGFFKKMYSLYNCTMMLICSFLIIFTKILAKLLYAKEFYISWNFVPFLLIASVFGAMSGYIGGIFAAVKDSHSFSKSTIYGAVLNIVLNIITVPVIGPIGAAASTTISYAVIWIIRVAYMQQYINIKINIFKECFAYLLLFSQVAVLYIVEKSIIMHYSIQVILFYILCYIYKEEIKIVLIKVIDMIRRKI